MRFNKLLGVGIVLLLLVVGLGVIGYSIYSMAVQNTAINEAYEADADKWKEHSAVMKKAILFIPEINNSVYLDDITSGVGRTAYNPDGEFDTSVYEIWCNSGYVWYITVNDEDKIVSLLRVTGATAIKNQMGIDGTNDS